MSRPPAAIPYGLVLPGTGDYRRVMRFLAALALLLQFQPLVGSVICLHVGMADAECTMPHEQQPALGTLTAPNPAGLGSCSSLAYCAPGPPALPKLIEQFQVTPFAHSAPTLNYSPLAPGEALRPLFPPPKA